MAVILSLQGCMAVGKTTAVQYVKEHRPDIFLSREDNGTVISEVHRCGLIKNYRMKKMVVPHIDEIWGKSYGYYNELEKKLDNIFFAYDGMEIIV